jgi:hypothetical protein
MFIELEATNMEAYFIISVRVSWFTLIFTVLYFDRPSSEFVEHQHLATINVPRNFYRLLLRLRSIAIERGIFGEGFIGFLLCTRLNRFSRISETIPKLVASGNTVCYHSGGCVYS